MSRRRTVSSVPAVALVPADSGVPAVSFLLYWATYFCKRPCPWWHPYFCKHPSCCWYFCLLMSAFAGIVLALICGWGQLFPIPAWQVRLKRKCSFLHFQEICLRKFIKMTRQQHVKQRDHFVKIFVDMRGRQIFAKIFATILFFCEKGQDRNVRHDFNDFRKDLSDFRENFRKMIMFGRFSRK